MRMRNRISDADEDDSTLFNPQSNPHSAFQKASANGFAAFSAFRFLVVSLFDEPDDAPGVLV